MDRTDRQALIVTDLGYGDAGKGTTVDYLARQLRPGVEVVRYNGGAQAAHNVVTGDGRRHTFAQFGSATFVPGARTRLSRFHLVNPINLFAEENALGLLGITDAFDRLSIDARAPITTPFHIAANRVRELDRGDARHGSCGLGIGETMIDLLDGHAIHAGDLRDRTQLRARLAEFQTYKHERMGEILDRLGHGPEVMGEARALFDTRVVDDLVDIYSDLAGLVNITDNWRPSGDLIFEGAQGVLLDEWRGFHPHTTWSTTTTDNARVLLDELQWDGAIIALGLSRSYMTRHGAGPFVSEGTLTNPPVELHNQFGDWQGSWRTGALDLVALRYALQVSGGIDELALTWMDQLPATGDWPVCIAYRHREQGLITDLPLPHLTGRQLELDRPLAGDLDAQEQLTKILLESEPLIELVAAADLVEVIETQLQRPVGLLSVGMEANAKRLTEKSAVATGSTLMMG